MLEVAHITRPHGLRGEVTVMLTSNRTERLAVGSVLHSPEGVLEVRAARPHKGGWIVAFKGVDDRDRAEALRGLVLSGEPIDDPDELWVHDLIGATLVDQHGVARGTVEGVIDNPASDLLELDTGALVPVQFVTGLDARIEVRVDVPPGLFDLDDA